MLSLIPLIVSSVIEGPLDTHVARARFPSRFTQPNVRVMQLHRKS